MSGARSCPIRDCAGTAAPGQLMCRVCWGRVPAPLQRAVYAAWAACGRRADLAAQSLAYRAARESALLAPALRGKGLLGVTLRQPFAFALSSGATRTLSRPLPPPVPPGAWLAICAGPDFDRAAATWMADIHGVDLPPQGLPQRAIVAVAQLQRAAEAEHSQDEWAADAWLWRLGDVASLPIAIDVTAPTGAGVWLVSEDLARRVRAGYALARPSGGLGGGGPDGERAYDLKERGRR